MNGKNRFYCYQLLTRNKYQEWSECKIIIMACRLKFINTYLLKRVWPNEMKHFVRDIFFSSKLKERNKARCFRWKQLEWNLIENLYLKGTSFWSWWVPCHFFMTNTITRIFEFFSTFRALTLEYFFLVSWKHCCHFYMEYFLNNFIMRYLRINF